MSDLQMPIIKKKLKTFKVFVSMATKLSKRNRFYKKYCNFKANYLTSANRNMNYVCTFKKVHICSTNVKKESNTMNET